MRKLVRLAARRFAIRLVGLTFLGLLVSTGVAAARACEPPAPVFPFAQWGDNSGYFLAPGGSFQSDAAGWTLDGATVSAGNAGFNFGAVSAMSSLTIGAGGSATSPSLCVNSTMPSLRFFAHQVTRGSDLKVQGVESGNASAAMTVTITDLPDGSMPDWAPTGRVALVSASLPAGVSVNGVLRFEVPGATGAWQIADIYVDPYRVS
jgi:hypothetical protein